jgi:agmatinase
MVDKKHLEALRDKYGNASGGDIFDPDFRAVAQSQFKGGDRRKWPFAGIPTFLDARGFPEAQDAGDFGGLDIALIGVPMDLGVTNRNGTRFGPRALRTMERIGPYDHVLRTSPLTKANVADIGDVPLMSRFDLAQCHKDIEAFYRRLVGAGVRPLSVGGDHSITSSILKALGEKEPVGLIHIDAHCDTAGPYEGTKFQHGGPFRLAVLDGVLDPRRTIQIGIRGPAEYLWEFSYESGMTVVHAEDVGEASLPEIIEKARRIVGTGTPEVGGLLPREVLQILRGLNGLNIIGGDVVEVAPQYDSTTNTAQIAAQVLHTILCLMVNAPVPSAA